MVPLLESGAWFIFLAVYWSIHKYTSIQVYTSIMKCGPTQNKNKFWVPSSSMRPFVTQFYLYVMTVCSRNVSFLWITTAFYWSSLRDDYCVSRSLASYLPRRHILSICHWDPHRCWVYYTSLIFSHYYLFPCNHCKNIPTSFPSIVRKPES